MSRKKKEVIEDYVLMDMAGAHLQEALILYFKDKFGDDFEVKYVELTKEKMKNNDVLDHQDNEFKLFVEFQREVK